jgi:hypothetical protein
MLTPIATSADEVAHRLPTAVDLDDQRVEVQDRADRPKRRVCQPWSASPWRPRARGGNAAHGVAAGRPVQFGHVGLDLAGRHAARVQGDDALDEAGQVSLLLGNDLVARTSVAIIRRDDPYRPLSGLLGDLTRLLAEWLSAFAFTLALVCGLLSANVWVS